MPLFKDLQADFLKRANGDVVIRCDQGRVVAEAEMAYTKRVHLAT